MNANAQTHFHARDAGLVRAVGPVGLTANVVNYTIGASIFVMPATCAALAGAWAPIAFIVAAIATAAITLCYAEAGARVPTSGGQSGFTEVAFGRYAGFLAGGLTYTANVLAAGAITAAAIDMLASFVPTLQATVARTTTICLWSVILFGIVGGKVRTAARIVSLATVIKLVPLALLLIVGLCVGKTANLSPPHLPVPGGFGQATLLAIFLFAGVHGALLAGGEVRDPAKTVPRALVFGMGIVIVIFIGCQLAAQSILGAGLAASRAPLAGAIATVSPLLGSIMMTGAMVSMAGWTASDALSTPRSLFALAQDGYLPMCFAELDEKTHTPRKAIALHLTLVILLATTGTFAALAAICAVVLVVLMIGACTAALRLRQKDVTLGGPVRSLPGLPLAAAIGGAAALAVGVQGTRAQLMGTAAIIFCLTIGYVVTTNRDARRPNGASGV